jgi:hypothetical protein
VTDDVIAKYIAEQNINQDEDFKVDGWVHLLLEARLVRDHRAGLWPEQGFQPVTRAIALRRWFVTHCGTPGVR